jgi:hypothetical protein
VEKYLSYIQKSGVRLPHCLLYRFYHGRSMTFIKNKLSKVEVTIQVAQLIKHYLISRNTRYVRRSWIFETWTEMNKQYDVPKLNKSGSYGTDRVRRSLKFLEKAGVLERSDTHVRVTDVRRLLDCCNGKLSLTDNL